MSGASDALRMQARLAIEVEREARRPLLFRLLGLALTEFDVDAACSYLEELEADAGLTREHQTQLALHRGAFEVLCGNLMRAEPVFDRLIGGTEVGDDIRAEATRGLGLVHFERIAGDPNPRVTDDKPGFWRFIDALMASERGDPQGLAEIVHELEGADPRSAYLATAHALARASSDPDKGSEIPLSEARRAVRAAADQGSARLATACWVLGVIEGRFGSPERGMAALLEAERLLHPGTYQSLSARAERSLVLLEMGAFEAARDLAAESLALAESRGARLRVAIAQATLSAVAAEQKHRGDAEALASRSIDVLRTGGLLGALRRVAPVLGLDAVELTEHRYRPISSDTVRALEVPSPSDPRLHTVLASIRSVFRAEDSAPLHPETFAELLSAETLAARAGISREHLTRRLVGELGLTLREVISRERLAAALPRLAGGEPAESVAASLGFSDARALRRALLRLTGRRIRDVRLRAF